MSLSILNLAKSATSTLSGSKKESFTDVGVKDLTTTEMVVFIFVFLLILFIIIYCCTCIYNIVLLKAIPSLKRLSTFEFFGLYIITHVLFT